MRDNTDAAEQAADNAWSERVRVEIYAGYGCPYCTKAKELCESKKIPYVYRNIDEEPDFFDQLVGRIQKWKTIPQIFIGAKHIGGYDDLIKHLDE
jgi:glutaredoxin